MTKLQARKEATAIKKKFNLNGWKIRVSWVSDQYDWVLFFRDIVLCHWRYDDTALRFYVTYKGEAEYWNIDSFWSENPVTCINNLKKQISKKLAEHTETYNKNFGVKETS